MYSTYTKNRVLMDHNTVIKPHCSGKLDEDAQT
jgi:hypothetical protein